MDKKARWICLLPLLVGSSAPVAQVYAVEEVPGYANGINIAGQVIGYWSLAFIWSPETGAVNLPSVAGAFPLGLGLNNTGGAVGSLLFSGKERFCPAKWTIDSLEFPWACSISSYAYGINDREQIVGIDENQTAIRIDADGSIFHVGVPESVGFAINSAGQWVGRYRTPTGLDQAFRYTDGKGVEDLPPLLSGAYSVALGINELGDSVGLAWTGSRFDVPVWRGGTVQNVSADSPYPANVGFGINDSGVAVGSSGSSPTSLYERAFVVTAEGGFQDLTDLIGDPSWVFERATGINDAGQIVGHGHHNGRVVGFRLTPIGK